MKKVFLLALVLVFTLTTVKVYSQEAAGANKTASVGKVSLENLEGLTEEQILALLKQLQLDDILIYLRLVVTQGSRELLVNMLGAFNKYIASLDPKQAMEVAQRAASENTELSFGVGRSGTPQVFVANVNEAMNNMVNNNNTQANNEEGKVVVNPNKEIEPEPEPVSKRGSN